MPSRLIGKLLVILFTAALAQVLPVHAYFNSDRTYVVPMQQWHGHLWVDVLINGERTKAIVDTGCDTIAIPPALAQRLNLALSASGKPVSMLDKETKGLISTIRDFRLGDLQMQNQKVDIVEYPYVIIGLPVLSKFSCTFDFDNSILTLAPSQPLPPDSMQIVPFWGLYAVQGWLSGRAHTFIIDTGADTTIASRASVANIPRILISENSQHRLKYCRFQQIRIGTHSVDNPEMAIYDRPNTQGNTAVNTGAIMLGLPFWQHYNVTFDFPTQRMYLSLRTRK